jgi:hypothetical protein
MLDDLHNGRGPLCINYPTYPTIVDVPGILNKLDSDSLCYMWNKNLNIKAVRSDSLIFLKW